MSLAIYQGASDADAALTSLSGQVLPPSLSVNSTSVFLTFSPNNLGFRGFRISYSFDIIDTGTGSTSLKNWRHFYLLIFNNLNGRKLF